MVINWWPADQIQPTNPLNPPCDWIPKLLGLKFDARIAEKQTYLKHCPVPRTEVRRYLKFLYIRIWLEKQANPNDRGSSREFRRSMLGNQWECDVRELGQFGNTKKKRRLATFGVSQDWAQYQGYRRGLRRAADT